MTFPRRSMRWAVATAVCGCLPLALLAQAAAAASQVVNAATGAELMSVVRGGSVHTTITAHVDMRGLNATKCTSNTNRHLLCVSPPVFASSEVASIRGKCAESFARRNADVPLPPLGPSQCVIHVGSMWLWVGGGANMWVDNVHVLLGPRNSEAEAYVELVRVDSPSQLWATKIGLQGDGKRGRAIRIHSGRSPVAKAMLADSFLGDMAYEFGGVAAMNLRSILALRNVTVQRTLSIIDPTDPWNKGAIEAGASAKLLCVDCTIDSSSAPGLTVQKTGSLYASPVGPVWDQTSGVYVQAASPMKAPIQFPDYSDTALQAVVTQLVPKPPALQSSPPALQSSPPANESRSIPPANTSTVPTLQATPPSPTLPNVPRSRVNRTFFSTVFGAVAAVFLALVSAALIFWCRQPSKLEGKLHPDTFEAIGGEARDHIHSPICPAAEDHVSVQSTSVPDTVADATSTGAHEYDVFLTHEWQGADGQNHKRVARVHAALTRLGVKAWFDAEKMRGDVQGCMAEGIEQSAGVLVFVTRRYQDKVTGNNKQDNCKFEFDIAMLYKLNSMVALVMEQDMLYTGSWEKKMKGLGPQLYVSLVDMDRMGNAQLDEYLRETLLPQMHWLPSR